jgi:hypothetical protein
MISNNIPVFTDRMEVKCGSADGHLLPLAFSSGGDEDTKPDPDCLFQFFEEKKAR